MFIVGIILLATLALMPPMLANLFDYPVVTIGLVTAPRGVGTLLAMVLVGRLIGKVDARWLMLGGLLATAWSLWIMTGFSLQMDDRLIIWSGVIQGFGMGFVWVPLTNIAFGTLAPQLRNEGTSLFNLLRNIGSSIGIAMVMALLTRNTQEMHSQLAEHVTLYDFATRNHPLFDAASVDGLRAIDGLVTRQASMIAYNNDFLLLFVLTLAMLPLVFLLRSPQRAAPSAVHAE